MTPEGKVKQKVKQILKAHDVFYFCPLGAGLSGRAGIPDIIGLYHGIFLGIEVKAGKNKTTKLQDIALAEITAHGGRSFVINETNINQLEEFLCCNSQRISLASPMTDGCSPA